MKTLKTCRVAFAFLFAVSSLMVLFSTCCCFQSPTVGSTQTMSEASREVPADVLNVDVWIFFSGSYGFLDFDIRNRVVVNATVSWTTPPSDPYTVTFFNIPFRPKYPIPEENLEPPYANTEYVPGDGLRPTSYLTIGLPANTSYFSVKLEGNLSSKSVFWRNSAEPSPLSIMSSVTNVTLYRLLLVPPSSSTIKRVYSRAYPDLQHTSENIEGYRCVVVTAQLPLVVLYQSETWEVYAFLVMFLTIFAVFLFAFFPKFGRVHSVTSEWILTFTSRLQRLLSKPIFLAKGVYQKILTFDSSKLLIAYFLCSLIMIGSSFVAGPDPRLKVYVFALDREIADPISVFINERGGVTVTSLDELGDLRTMANVGVFSAAVIGRFVPTSERDADLKIYPALDNIPNILILNIPELPGPDEQFSSEIKERYDYKTSVVNDYGEFEAGLSRIERRENALGLDVNPDAYMGVSAFVGLCSFILVFLGLAFVASRLIEVGKKPGIRGFPEAIAYTILYFVFTQITYIACSALLAMPLGLHTSRLESKVTAVSLIGFGGGSRPRMFVGLAGFLFGALISLKEGINLDKAGLISLLMAGFFIIVDPLTGGILFHEFILLYTVGPYFETAVETQSYVKTFLAEIGITLGGWASPTYGLSTGTILYCAGTVPFCLFSKLRRSTATVLLFSCAFFAASGSVRVADMNPWSAVASLIPGVVAGFVFAALFSLLSLAEGLIRTKIWIRRSIV